MYTLILFSFFIGTVVENVSFLIYIFSLSTSKTTPFSLIQHNGLIYCVLMHHYHHCHHVSCQLSVFVFFLCQIIVSQYVLPADIFATMSVQDLQNCTLFVIEPSLFPFLFNFGILGSPCFFAKHWVSLCHVY